MTFLTKCLICFAIIFETSTAFENDNTNTMVINTDHHLYTQPAFGKKFEKATLKRGETIFLVDSLSYSDLKGRDRNFRKIQTNSGNTGFVVDWAIISSDIYQKQQDTLTIWKKQAQSSLSELRQKNICKDKDLPPELDYNYPWDYFGPNNKYGVLYADNRYNRSYQYIILADIDGACHTIIDIIPITKTLFKPDSRIWFEQCICSDKSDDCSTVISIYVHSKNVNKHNLVKPEKAWRPNLQTMKLENVDPETVKCGVVNPEDKIGP